MSVAVKVLQYFGNISALVYFSTPLFQVLKQKLYKDIDSIKSVSLALIISILFNCLFWLLNAIIILVSLCFIRPSKKAIYRIWIIRY